MGVGESAQEGRTQDLLTQDDAEQWRKGHAPTAKIVSQIPCASLSFSRRAPPRAGFLLCVHTLRPRDETHKKQPSERTGH